MSYRDPKADRQLADALRDMGAADRTSTREMHLLARRIVKNADPMLRVRRRSSAWWEYAANWGRALVPLGLSAATLAVVGMLWLMPAPASVAVDSAPAGEHAALLGAVANRVPSHELLDLVVTPSLPAAGENVTAPQPSVRDGDGR